MHLRALTISAFVAFGLPFLLGYGVLPIPNFINELASLLGFGFLLVAASQERAAAPLRGPWWWVMSALALLIVLTLWQAVGAPAYALELHGVTAGYLLLAGMAFHLGWRAGADDARGQAWMTAICRAVALAAVLAALGGLVQYFKLPGQWALISDLESEGRAFGFIRQPNQQASFLVIGLLAFWHLRGRSRAATVLAWLGAPVLVAGILATGSRMGLLLLAFVIAWSLLIPARRSLRFTLYLLLIAVAWLVSFWLLHYYGDFAFYGIAKVNQSLNEGAGVRPVMWAETLKMIAQQPWFGLGLRHYGPYYVLGDAGINTGVVMTHSHNLFLQLAFDFGVPAAVLVSLVLAAVLWKARASAADPIRTGALAVVLCIGVHAMLEFPLWYVYFLTLGMFMLGMAATASLGRENRAEPMAAALLPPREGHGRMALAGSGILLVGLGVWMNHDFYRASAVFLKAPDRTLEQRIEAAQDVVWFRRYVDYADLVRQPVTAANAAAYWEGMSAIACGLLEPLYQSALIMALAYQNRMDEARRLLYIYIRMSKGSTAHLRKRFEGHEGAVFDQLRRDLDHPVEIKLAPGQILSCLR